MWSDNHSYAQMLAMSNAGASPLAYTSLGRGTPGHALSQSGQFLPRSFYCGEPVASPSCQNISSNPSTGDDYRPQGLFSQLNANQVDFSTPSNDHHVARPQYIGGGRPALAGPIGIIQMDFLTPSNDHQDARPQYIGGRPTLAGSMVNNSQAYQNLQGLHGQASSPSKVLPNSAAYSSPQHGSVLVHQAHLLQTQQRAELASIYPRGHALHPDGRGPLLNPLNEYPSLLAREGVGGGPFVNGHLGRGPVSLMEHDYPAPRMLNPQVPAYAASTRQGRENLERYLFSQKLIGYSSSRLSPEPLLKRPRYSFGSANAEITKYHRVPKRDGLLSIKSRDGSPHRQRDEKKEIRRRVVRSPNHREHKSSHPDSNADNVALKEEAFPKVLNGEQSDQSSEGLGGTPRRAKLGDSQLLMQDKPQETILPADHENILNSDKVSERSSMAADRSDSLNALKRKEAEQAPEVVDGPLAGMIFGCSSATFHECMKLRLFGLPAKNKKEVLRVAPGTKLFLFNFDTKELSGIFEAVSPGGMWIYQDAFREYGGFPAQVKVDCTEMCPNLSISQFRKAIKDNFFNEYKFKFDLNVTQVEKLRKMFRAEARSRARHRELEYIRERVRDVSPIRYGSMVSQDYLLPDAPHQRQYYLSHNQRRSVLRSLL